MRQSLNFLKDFECAPNFYMTCAVCDCTCVYQEEVYYTVCSWVGELISKTEASHLCKLLLLNI